MSAMSNELFGKPVHDHNVPCVVCESIGRVAALRIPGRRIFVVIKSLPTVTRGMSTGHSVAVKPLEKVKLNGLVQFSCKP